MDYVTIKSRGAGVRVSVPEWARSYEALSYQSELLQETASDYQTVQCELRQETASAYEP